MVNRAINCFIFILIKKLFDNFFQNLMVVIGGGRIGWGNKENCKDLGVILKEYINNRVYFWNKIIIGA